MARGEGRSQLDGTDQTKEASWCQKQLPGGIVWQVWCSMTWGHVCEIHLGMGKKKKETVMLPLTVPQSQLQGTLT